MLVWPSDKSAQDSAEEVLHTMSDGRTLSSALRDKVLPSVLGRLLVVDLSNVWMLSCGLNSIESSCMRLKRRR